MPVAPIRNNGQEQSLTVLLRNIISEYPAGGGVLRELCQNADDAGADAIEFVLDTRQHPKENLLHKDLAKFQGISLLAYNNKRFAQKDFESLMRIGDSGKAKDLTATGKFGRGFNSVYNWTDNPSILSGTSLLLLDPHKAWSSDIGCPGGPLYDFVANSNEPEIKNHLAAFGSILESYDTAFEGTIIRLPLRDEDQAKRSEIVEDHMSTSQKDIEDVFQLFTNELVESLLFLRNLRSITLRINDKIFAKAKSIVPNERKNDRGENPVNEGYRQVFVEQSKEHYESDFMMEISILQSAEPDTDPSETKIKYAISHYLQKSTKDESLQKWARSHKLFPWIAIANPLDKTPDFDGRLFTTLPLPIQTKHPAHIHGILSITPDRSNIHSGGDTTMSANSSTRLGAQWNQWLLQECAPHAWVRNLEFIRSEDLSPGWDFWPAGKQGELGQLWMGILGAVFKKVVEDGYELLPTLSGAVKPTNEVAFTLGIPDDLHFSLRDAGAPIVFPPVDRRTEIGALDHENIGLEYLSPSTGRRHLTTIKDSDALHHLDIKARMVLLDYVLSDYQVPDFKNCEAPLIPLSDGTFRGFEMPASQDDRIFMARDTVEVALFQKSPERTVKTSALSEKSQEILVERIADIEKHTRIKAWTVEDAAQYCSSYEFDIITEPTPVVKIDKPKFNDFVNLFWKWVSKVRRRGAGVSTLVNALKDLWLIPLGNQTFQRIGSISEYPVLNVSANKGIGSFLRQAESALANRFTPEIMYLYTGDGFPDATKSLQKLGIIKDYDDRTSLMKWLEITLKVFVSKLDYGEKMELTRHLFDLSRNCSPSERLCMEQTIRKLPIFQEANDLSPNERPWRSIVNDDPNSPVTYIGVENLPITLDTPQHIFIDIKYDCLKGLVSHLQLFKCPSPPEILSDYVVPGISETGTPSDNRRTGFIKFALDHFKSLSPEARSSLSRKEIVPVSTEKLRRPGDTVFGEYVAALYFQEEERCTLRSFDEGYHNELVSLGMSENITEQVILERISAYSSSGRSHSDIDGKVSTLFSRGKPPPQPLSKEYMELCWIPATSPEGELGLFSAVQCRSAKLRYLYKYFMPIMKSRIFVSEGWEKWLGWDAKLTVQQMSKQLHEAKKKNDLIVIAHLVEYWHKIYMSGTASLTVDAELKLESRKWIPGSSGGFYSPTEIFFTGATHLPPHYDIVCERFLRGEPNIKRFLTHMGVQQAPTFDQLKDLQDRIATEEPLSAQDLEVALYIVEQIAILHNKKQDQNLISDFKAPDQDGIMRTFSELTASGIDAPISLGNRPTPHPRISESTIEQLGLPTMKDRILASLNDPRLEQDFSQTQSPKAVIRDTLQRYSVESTFSEYLANAEDCMDEEGKTATRIDWMIDHSTDYPTEKLIAQELEAVQGKALFCYNDGVFTDEDFRSIIDVGIGSKGQDLSKIGKFGKGALTMYHWTSAPSFISGDFYVIFDPENSFLPPIPLTGKPRGGLKFRIRDVQAYYPDQLKPFEGIFGFPAGSSRFEGTIFRFPFRGLTDRSELCPKNITSMESCTYLDTYKEKARISLIFLKHISSISYWEKGLEKPIWTVSASSRVLKDRSPRINEVEITVTSFGRMQISGPPNPPESNKWWTIEGFTEDQHIPPELTEMAEYNRLEATYGLAVPEHPQHTFCFMGLPLQTKYHLSLPASINANMALQSDRQTPISEEKNDRLGGLKWNNWIFKEGIVNLYLLFLRHLMKLHGTAGYRFWPTPPSELTNPDHVSSTISTEFWKKAGESSFDLYPQIPPLLSTPRRRQLQTSENLSIKKTIFNFLSTEQSKFIIPLLVQLGITNIATPPPTIVKGLTKATTDEVSLLLVTPVYVRDLLRNPTRCKLLQDHWKKDPGTLMRNINRLLSFLLKDTSEDCLTGCSLLPLEGGSWGTFSPNPISQIQYFASSTPLERSILEVAAGRLVSEGLGGIVIDGLLEKGMNISPLTFDHIASLCPLVESKNPEYRKAWLVNVWEYFRQRVTKDPDSRDKYLESIESLPLYCGSVVGEQDSLRFLTPLSFASGSLPAIVDPRTPFLERGKATLFQALNGLILVDKSTFPTINTSAESVEQPSGACCLVKAIGTLPFTVPTIHSLSQVFSSVPMEGIKALSELVLPHISDLLGRDPTIVSTLKQLPIWPVASSSSFQSAAMLKLAPHTTLSLITMIDQTTFLKPDLAFKHREDLRKLGVQQLSYLDFLNEEVGLARGYLPAENIREYQRCIEMVYKENPDVFKSCDLAVDGDLRFCRPSTLYDSSVPLFQAAFRDQQRSRFLHPELAMSHVWRDLLIKNVSGPTYIKCARSIERRNSQTTPDSQIESDACTVFDHLCYDDREMHSWSEWKSLLEIRFAPIQETTASWDQSRLKNQQREIFRQRNKLVAISEAVDPRMEGISWAVKPVLRKQMGSLAFSMITSKKLMVRPTTVIEHLEFLASHCEEITQNELQIRIPEIKEAYEHLEQNMHTYTIQESALIWLNVENEDLGKMTREIFRNSWSCSRNLCLNSNYDSGEIKRVRSFLGRFHSLLLHANVSAIIPPDSPAPVTPTTQSPILEGLLELRERELLFDITITAHKPAMLFQTLQIFKAHKIVLASVSDYWKTMLTSTFKESSTPEISLQDDPSTVKVLLDYIYTNKFVEPPHEDDVTRQLENLLDQLEKSEKWFLPSFKRSMENYLSDDHWIRPETVKSILRNARTCNADRLAHVCEKYIQNNRAIVEREAPKEEYESQGYGFRIF